MGHKLAWEGVVVVVEGYTQGEEERSMVEDRSSYSDEHRWVDKEVGVEQGDRGIRVVREGPLVPLVPCIRGYREIHGIREGQEVPCILAVREVLAVGMVLALAQGLGMAVVAVAEGVEVVHSTLVRKLERTLTGIHIHKDKLLVFLYPLKGKETKQSYAWHITIDMQSNQRGVNVKRLI